MRAPPRKKRHGRGVYLRWLPRPRARGNPPARRDWVPPDLCGFSPVWMSMCVFKFPAQANDLSHPEQLSFLSTVSSDFWLGRMTCCKWYNWTSFLYCESTDASSDWKCDWMICHTGHKCAVDITLHGQLLHDIGCICSHTIFKQKVSHQCGWGCVSLNH